MPSSIKELDPFRVPDIADLDPFKGDGTKVPLLKAHGKERLQQEKGTTTLKLTHPEQEKAGETLKSTRTKKSPVVEVGKEISETIAGTGLNIGKGYLQGASRFYKGFQSLHPYFGELAKRYEAKAEEFAQVAAESPVGAESIPAKIYQGIGALIPEGIKWGPGKVGTITGVVLSGIQAFEESKGDPKAAALAIADRLIMGKIFHAIGASKLTRPQQALVMGGAMGGQTALATGDIKETATSTLIGTLLPMSGGFDGKRDTIRVMLIKEGVAPKLAEQMSSQYMDIFKNKPSETWLEGTEGPAKKVSSVLEKIKKMQQEGKTEVEIKASLSMEEKVELNALADKASVHKRTMKSENTVDKIRTPLSAYGMQKKRIEAGKGKPDSQNVLEESLNTAIQNAKDILAKAPEMKGAVEALFRKEGLDFAGILGNERGGISFGKKPKPISTNPVEAMHQRTDKAIEQLEKTTLKDIRDSFVKQVVDTSGNLKREIDKYKTNIAKNVKIYKDLVAGASPKASAMMEMFEDKYLKGFSKEEEGTFNHYVSTMGSIISAGQRKPGLKQPEAINLAEAQNWINDMENITGLSTRQVYRIKQAADGYFKMMKDLLAEERQEGLFTQEGYDSIKDNIYSPRLFLQYYKEQLENISSQMFGKLVSVPKNDIKILDEGSTELLYNKARNLLAKRINSAQALIFRNRAAKALLEFAESEPNNPIVRKANITGYEPAMTFAEFVGKNPQVIAQGLPRAIIETMIPKKPIFENVPTNHTTISAMIDGKPTPMFMPDALAHEWVKSDPQISHALSQTLRLLSGSTFLKAMATGYNPAFAMSNIFRDIGLIWMTAEAKGAGYSSTLPVFLGQLGGDMLKVLPDVVRRKGRVADYINEGGGLNLLTHYGRLSGTSNPLHGIKTEFRALGDALSYLGETSELLTRLALRERAIKSGKSNIEATWLARNYLDFSQGGATIKALDTVVPYLNAGIQGSRSIFRAAKSDPARFAYQVGQLMLISSALYAMNTRTEDGKKMMAQIEPEEKRKNFIIGLPALGHKDKNNNIIYPYFKIPKDYGQIIYSMIPEMVLEWRDKGKFPSKQAWKNLVDATGVDITKLSPTLTALHGYALNKNFWTGEDIWKSKTQNVNAPGHDPSQEFFKGEYATHPGFAKAGEVTGLSPERLKYSASQIFTANNPYVNALDVGYELASKQLSDEVRYETNKTIWDQMIRISAAKRFVGLSKPYIATDETVRTIKEQTAQTDFDQDREIDDLSNQYFASEMKDVEAWNKMLDYIKTQPKEDQERLEKRVLKTYEYRELPNRKFWVNTTELNPEARALAFWTIYKTQSDEEKQTMLDIAKSLKGYSTERFEKRIVELYEAEGEQPK